MNIPDPGIMTTTSPEEQLRVQRDLLWKIWQEHGTKNLVEWMAKNERHLVNDNEQG
jgi:hypothetical protein